MSNKKSVFWCAYGNMECSGKVIRFELSSDDIYFIFEGGSQVRIPIGCNHPMSKTLETINLEGINYAKVNFNTGKIEVNK